jgi:hypothetical protein
MEPFVWGRPAQGDGDEVDELTPDHHAVIAKLHGSAVTRYACPETTQDPGGVALIRSTAPRNLSWSPFG